MASVTAAGCNICQTNGERLLSRFLDNSPSPEYEPYHCTGDNGIAEHFLTAVRVSRPRTACLFPHSLSTVGRVVSIKPPTADFPQTFSLLELLHWLRGSSKGLWKFLKGVPRPSKSLKRAADILCKGGLEELFWENRERSRVSSCFGLPHARW